MFEISHIYHNIRNYIQIQSYSSNICGYVKKKSSSCLQICANVTSSLGKYALYRIKNFFAFSDESFFTLNSKSRIVNAVRLFLNLFLGMLYTYLAFFVVDADAIVTSCSDKLNRNYIYKYVEFTKCMLNPNYNKIDEFYTFNFTEIKTFFWFCANAISLLFRIFGSSNVVSNSIIIFLICLCTKIIFGQISPYKSIGYEKMVLLFFIASFFIYISVFISKNSKNQKQKALELVRYHSQLQ